MNKVFADFVRTFQQHTVNKGGLSANDIMYRYISTLEHLAPRFGSETYSVCHLELREDGAGNSSYSSTARAKRCSEDDYKTPATHEIMVCGVKGIQWRKVSTQKVRPHKECIIINSLEGLFAFYFECFLGSV